MLKKAQEERLQILKKLVTASEYNQEIKNNLSNMLFNIEITEKTAQEESIGSLVKFICYTGMNRAAKKEANFPEMSILISRIDYCYKYLK